MANTKIEVANVNDCIKIGDKYYLKKDVYAVFDTRIPEKKVS